MKDIIKEFFKQHWGKILLFVVCILPIGIYIWEFHTYILSGNPNDWGVFGDYIGGTYSIIIAVLVVYLARNLEKRDEEQRVRKEALREVYYQILSIQENQRPNQNKVTKLFKLIEKSRLYIDDDFYDRLKRMANIFGEGNRDREKENEILDELKSEYER